MTIGEFLEIAKKVIDAIIELVQKYFVKSEDEAADESTEA